ncbi:MAG: hypothetical protein J6X18_07310 [Bacteroidales bacterium]|nr:hypothetical protein [Bacteroidales bacterium]
MTKYGIFQIKKHDYGWCEKPSLSWGWFNTIEEAQDHLKNYYHNGEKRRQDNDFYGYHYTYWYEIYASDSEHPIQFYDMDDYVRDLVDGEGHLWDTMTDEQKEMLVSMSPPATKFWLILIGKININNKRNV